MKKILSYTLVVLLIGLFATSCTKYWEENNVDPNNPVDVPMTNLLGNSIIYTGENFYDDWQGMNNFLSYAGHITKIFYIDEARYQYRTGVVDAAWRNYYRIQMDLSKIKDKAVQLENPYMEAVANTYSVFLWQMAVDQWGDIPYSEAIKGESDDNWTPAYDKAVDIYNDLFTRLEDANSKFNISGLPPSQVEIGDGDFIYGGDKDKWQKFANSIRLRLAMRISKVNPGKAKQEIETVLSNPSKYPIFTSRDDEAVLQWEGVVPYKEPWAYNHESRDDHAMAKTLIDTLISLNDPRLPVYAEPVDTAQHPASTIYIGAPEGAPDNAFSADTISRIGQKYRDDPAGYTWFLRYAEVEFIIAEAALNGWSTPEDAETAYSNGIYASFDETGVTDQFDTYMADPRVAFTGAQDEKYAKIYKQKWLALFKEGQEIWAEQRRTDFPPMPPASGTVYDPGAHNRGPFHYPYPVSEQNLNSANIAPVLEGVVDDFWGTQLFWDTRKGVH